MAAHFLRGLFRLMFAAEIQWAEADRSEVSRP
jgi:hypothetical protein